MLRAYGQQLISWRGNQLLTRSTKSAASYLHNSMLPVVWHNQTSPRTKPSKLWDQVPSQSATARILFLEKLTEEEIWGFVADFAQAAKNAMNAGFDGVQIHSAYGTLVDQFVQDVSNQRTDSWGGSIEKRSRFAIEVVKAVAKEVGIDNVGIRFSPFSTYLSMGMQDTVSQHAYLIKELAQMGISHLHLVEPRVDGIVDVENTHSIAPLIGIWHDNTQAPLILAGGYTPGDARKKVDEVYKGRDIAIRFGRPFVSNPDLPYRIKHDLPLTPPIRDVFYAVKDPKGYADWPFSKEFLAERQKSG